MNDKEIKAAEAAVELNQEQLEEIDGGKTIWVKKVVTKKKKNFWGKTKKKTRTYLIPVEVDD